MGVRRKNRDIKDAERIKSFPIDFQQSFTRVFNYCLNELHDF